MEQQELVSNNISYSLIKSFDENGPSALIQRYTIKNKGISFGTKLDDFISLDKEEFNKLYVINDQSLGTDLDALAAEVVKNKIDVSIIDDSIIQQIYDLSIVNDLFKRITKKQSRLDKFNNVEFYNHVALLYTIGDKEIISSSEYSKLIDCKRSLYNHKSTKKYFNNISEDEYFQLKIEFEYLGKNVKVILDKVNINHEEKTIQGLDLKSGSVNSDNFMSNFFKFKYYIQGALYQKALEKLKEENFKDYTILPFKFIYLPTFNINNPKVFILTNKWIDAAWNGFKTTSGYAHRGINEIVEEIIWHIDNQIFNETREFYLNDEINLDDSFIYL